MFDLEIYILLIIALFFSTLYLLNRKSKEPWTWAGIVGSMTWLIMSLVYFVGRVADPALSPTRIYVVSLFFGGIGIIFIMLWMVDLLNLGKWAKELGEVET